jgi:hypothetical protein
MLSDVIERSNCGAVPNLGSLALVMPRNRDIFAHSLPVMFGDPLLNCRIERRAFVLPLQFPEGRLGQMRDVWKPALSDTRISDDVTRLAELQSGAVFAPVISAHSEKTPHMEFGQRLNVPE